MMSRITTFTILFLQVLVWSPTANCLSLDDRFEQIAEEFIKMKNLLATKDARFEELEAKMARLEELEVKIAQLETLELKVEEQKEEIVALRNQIDKRQANSPLSQLSIHPSSADNNNEKTAVAAVAMPKSCTDLRYLGHTINGLYMIMGSDKVETVFCDFTALPSDPTYETRIGYVDVKSSPVYFYVQRYNVFNTIMTPIPFDVERLNVGGAVNSTTGKFTAPKDGTYAFSFTGDAWFPATSSRGNLDLYMSLNSNSIGWGWADEVSNATEMETFSFQSTFNLVAGDQIWLEIAYISAGAYLRGVFYTQFSGYLLEENIAFA